MQLAVVPSSAQRPELDGLRALAVIAVVVFHARYSWLPTGYVGVDIFFVLSGFLITSVLLREIARTGRLSFRLFYLRRLLRLAPALILLCLVVGIAFTLLKSAEDRHGTLVGVLTALTYSSAPMAASGVDLGWMLHTWSLSVEEYFYVVWPLAVFGLARLRRPLSIVMVLVGMTVAYRLAVGFLTDWSIQRIAYSLDTRAEQLLIGALLASVAGRLTKALPIVLPIAAGVLLVGFALLPGDLGVMIYRHGGSTLVAVLAASVIAGTLNRSESLLVRGLGCRPMAWVGRRSYGIYLWCPPIVGIVAALPLPDLLQPAAKLALTLIVPAVSFALVEQPLLRLKDRLPGRRRTEEDVRDSKTAGRRQVVERI